MRGLAVAAVLAVAAITVTVAGCSVSQTRAAATGHAAAALSTPASVGTAVSPGTAASPGSTASSGLAAAPVPAASMPVPLPSAGSVNYADPTEVSRAAVIIQWTMDTVTDSSQYQAELRSAAFLAPSYLTQLKANPPVAASGYQWDQWAAHRAYTTVSLVAEHDDPPADTATTAYRQWGITVTPHGSEGWTGAPLEATVFVLLSRAGPGQRWLVSAVSVDPSS
jgi:hypothetical protein